MNGQDDFLRLDDFPVIFINPADDSPPRIAFTQLLSRWNMNGTELWALMKKDAFQANVKPYFISADCEGRKTAGNLWFDLEDVQEFESLFPQLLPGWLPGKKPKETEPRAKPKEKKFDPKKHFDAKQRHMWRVRAVAQWLWMEESAKQSKFTTIAEMAQHREVVRFGCEGTRDTSEEIKSWIRHLSPQKKSDPDWKILALIWNKTPRMMPKQIAKERAEALVFLVLERMKNSLKTLTAVKMARIDSPIRIVALAFDPSSRGSEFSFKENDADTGETGTFVKWVREARKKWERSRSGENAPQP